MAARCAALGAGAGCGDVGAGWLGAGGGAVMGLGASCGAALGLGASAATVPLFFNRILLRASPTGIK